MKTKCARCKNDDEAKPIQEWKINEPIESFFNICYFDQLCSSCISDIQSLISDIGILKLPKKLNRGEHYYIENGKWVFTEKYHLLKNYCCKNGCRHCPYGYKHGN